MQSTTNNRRKSMRLEGYDYSTPGYYAVTVCTNNREYFFGDVINYEMQLSNVGEVAERELVLMPTHFDNVEVDAQIVMPNHIHVIFALGGKTSLHQVVAVFKSRVSRIAGVEFGVSGIWQRRFFDHIVRSEISLERQREYVRNNPVQWDLDELNNQNWLEYLDANPNLRWLQY
jgi:putative transposase